MHLDKAPAGSERICASATKPSGVLASMGGWSGEVQEKSLVSMEVQRSIGELLVQTDPPLGSVKSCARDARQELFNALLGHDDHGIVLRVLLADKDGLGQTADPRSFAYGVSP